MRHTPLPLLAVALMFAHPRSACAQTDASLGLGAGTVRFPGGATLGLLSFTPSLQLLGPYRQFSVGTTVANLAQGGWYGQGRLGVWLATRPIASRWQVATDFDVTGTALGGHTRTGAAHLTAEAQWSTSRWGLAAGAGGASGWITGTAAVTAPRMRARTWWQTPSSRLALFGAIESTRFLGAWFTDLDGGMVARVDRLELRLWASGRASAAYGSRLAALASVQWRLSPMLSLEATGGSVLPDPYQGFPRSGFVAAGIRFHAPPRGDRGNPNFRSTGLSVTRQGDRLVLRVRLRAAHNVTIAGDWNGWLQTPLAQAQDGTWQIALTLSAGTYHFSLLLDGSPWTIPDGVPSVPDGMGGRVAVLVVL